MNDKRVVLRELTLAENPWIALVARRMGETLDEVIGRERDEFRYSQAWLEDRVRQHLDPACIEGAVFLAFISDGRDPVGHTVLRREDDGPATRGVFATTWVSPAHRRLGIARRLVERGERWMEERGMTSVRTDTAADNGPLCELFVRRGYEIIERAPDDSMVRLGRAL